MTSTCTTLDELPHVLLGYTSGTREGGRRQLNRNGGSWERIAAMIEHTLVDTGISTTVYDLPRR